MELQNIASFSHLVACSRPYAEAILRGNDSHPGISGAVRFYPADQGTLVVAEVFGLPESAAEAHGYGPFYAMHLHQGSACGSGAGEDAFAQAGTHYNPTGQPHPMHAGDFPPLLGNGGYAYSSFYTGRFRPQDAVGHTVIVHQNTDDFHTQPSGNAGGKLACGEVKQGIQPA